MTLLMLLLSSASQCISAAEAMLITEQHTLVYLRPSFHSVLVLMVMFGRAVWRKQKLSSGNRKVGDKVKHRLICNPYHKEGVLCSCSLGAQTPDDESHTLQ